MRLIDFFRRRLQVKVISLIVVILILGFGVLVMLNIQRESNALIAKNRETSRLLASTIVESIENGMLAISFAPYAARGRACSGSS
jgi:hypothetical protein